MNSEQIEKKRQGEIRLISEMISLYCKKKLIQGKWASRTVANGTANVITAVKPSGRFCPAPA